MGLSIRKSYMNIQSKQLTHAHIKNEINEEKRLSQWRKCDGSGGDYLNGNNGHKRR